ncbi:MAG: 1-deoxy-D-xylulose-5-phosphate reductoisomerase, partial [Thermoguttaceae bacterium]|nr:1-deoxy-D-xylulose-5-phosphate reductoisomerase [Thermoguttaceae bacterium]
MTRQNISLLGSTGSIGCSTLDVIAHSGGAMQLCALAGHCNVKLLIEQAQQFKPKYVAVTN